MAILGRMSSSEQLLHLSLRLNPFNVISLNFLSSNFTDIRSRILKQLIVSHFEQDYAEILDFASFCEKNKSQSKAQIHQDLFASWANQATPHPFFCEFGAMDGVLYSNTIMLEKELGWKGILAEPIPFLFNNISKNRNCYAFHGCVTSTGNQKIKLNVDVSNPEYSSILGIKAVKNNDVIEADTITLEQLLEKFQAPREIAFLSIDTEGTEYPVIEKFPFHKYSFKAMAIEHNYNRTNEGLLDSLLLKNGYRRVFREISLFDAWYLRID